MVAFLFPNPKLKDHAQSLSMISFSMLLKGQANGKKSKQAFNYKTTMEMSNVLAHLKNDHLLTSIFYLILKMVRFIWYFNVVYINLKWPICLLNITDIIP